MGLSKSDMRSMYSLEQQQRIRLSTEGNQQYAVQNRSAISNLNIIEYGDEGEDLINLQEDDEESSSKEVRLWD